MVSDNPSVKFAICFAVFSFALGVLSAGCFLEPDKEETIEIENSLGTNVAVTISLPGWPDETLELAAGESAAYSIRKFGGYGVLHARTSQDDVVASRCLGWDDLDEFDGRIVLDSKEVPLSEPGGCIPNIPGTIDFPPMDY